MTNKNIPIDQNLHKEFKIFCANNDIQMKDCNELLIKTVIRKTNENAAYLIRLKREQDNADRKDD